MIQKRNIIKMSKVRSRKNKGQRLQKHVVTKLRDKFNLDKDEPTCFDGDITARIMGGSGIDVILSPAARKLINYDIECKNCETWHVPKWWSQTKTNTKKDRKPLLIVKKNHHEELVILKLDDFLTLL